MSSHPPNRPDEDSQQGTRISNSKLKNQKSKLCFVCVGAGSGSRFSGDKLAEPLGDATVFSVALGALSAAFPEAPLVVVVAAERMDAWRDRLAADYPTAHFVAGGGLRHESARAGVLAAVGMGAEIVAIHDAARPLVDPRDITGVVWALGEADAAILVAPVTDTVKRTAADGTIAETLTRNDLRLAQTPQVFRIDSLLTAWERAGLEEEWSDESSVLESAGLTVRSVVAQHPNPKLTNESDLQLIRCLHEARSRW